MKIIIREDTWEIKETSPSGLFVVYKNGESYNDSEYETKLEAFNVVRATKEMKVFEFSASGELHSSTTVVVAYTESEARLLAEQKLLEAGLSTDDLFLEFVKEQGTPKVIYFDNGDM
jgi:hypothetical protein